MRNEARRAGKGSGVKMPSSRVHNDYTTWSSPQRVRDLMGDEAEELLKHRYAIINLWRPIAGPLLKNPLALCDATSLEEENLVASELRYPDRTGETYSVTYNPAQRWFYFPKMTADEYVLIRCFNSSRAAARPASRRMAVSPTRTPRTTPRRAKASRCGWWCSSRRKVEAHTLTLPSRARWAPPSPASGRGVDSSLARLRERVPEGRVRELGDDDDEPRPRLCHQSRLPDHLRAVAAAGAGQVRRRDDRRQHRGAPAVRDAASAGLLFPARRCADGSAAPTDHHTFCPYKGTASYWTIAVGDRVAENAVWGYPEPFDEVAAIKDYVAFYWNRVDSWCEEDEEIFVHPRDPYKRVDVVDSSRPVQVVVGGEMVAETRRARFLFETRLPTRYYIPPEDVRMDLLVAERQGDRLPLQGHARY